MIEKMTKYSFIMLSSYTEDFLQKLQEIACGRGIGSPS